MKKVYTTIILFVSLFFFCSHSANAATKTYSLLEENFNLLNEDFYNTKNLALDLSKEIDMKYIYIFYNSDVSLYYVLFFNEPFSQVFKDTPYFYYQVTINGNYHTNPFYRYIYKDGILTDKYQNSYTEFLIRYSGGFNLSTYLYSNYPVINSSSDDIIITYNDYSYTIESNAKFLSLYEHYLNINGLTDEDLSPDIHKEEKEILSNFYTLVIEKINLLANSIINNYIYLTVIGIFILIFVFCLIRRYLL